MPFPADDGGDDATARMARAWRELRRGPATMVLIEQLFGPPGEPDSVDAGLLDVLDLLTTRDDRRMSDLASELGVDPSTVTRTLQRLEAAGLAQRSPAAADGRVVTVQLTDEGRRLHAVVAARRTAILDGIMSTFAAAERDQLVALVERFVEALEHFAGVRGLDAAPG